MIDHDHLDRRLTGCYRLGGMPYVPHFSALGVYVAPGGKVASRAILERAGAVAYTEYLWRRPEDLAANGPQEGWRRLYRLG